MTGRLLIKPGASAVQVNGQLHITWSYSQAVHRRGTIEDLAQAYLGHLKSLLK